MKKVCILALLVCTLSIALASCGKKKTEEIEQPDPSTAKIAVLVGTTGEKIADTKYPEAEKLPFDSINDAVLALISGKADYIISSYTNCINFVRQNPDDLAILPDRLSDEATAIAVNKEETKLLEDINRILARFVEDGTLDRIIGNWIREDDSEYIRDDIPVRETGEVLAIAVSAEREPMCFVENGIIVGLDAELVQRIAYELNMRVEFHDMKFSAMIPSVLSGKTPIAASNITATQERRESVNFTTSYFTNPQSLLTRAEFVKDSPNTDRKTVSGSLTGKKLGSMTGTICETLAIENYPEADYSSFNGVNDMMAALKSGKLDYCSMPEVDAVNYGREDSGYKIAPGMLAKGTSCIAVAKGNEVLVNQLNTLLDEYEAAGTLDRLRENWIRPDGSDYVTDELPKHTEGPELRLAFCSGLEPLCFVKDGEATGMDIELAYRLAYDLGCRLTLSDMSFSALIPAVESGRADIAISSIAATEERAKMVDFTRSYYDRPIILVYYEKDTSEDDGFFSSLTDSFYRNFIIESRWKLVVSGIGITLLLSVCSGIAGAFIGFGVCLMRRSRYKIIRTIAVSLTRILQGTPIVVLLMILYYVILNKTGLDGITVAIIAFGLNFGAYASEIMLSGIHAVDSGQREAAAAIGYTSSQAFLKIIFPQAARHFLPVLKGEFISLVKMTSIVGYVAVQDLTKVSDIIRSRTYEAFFPLIATAVIYFILSFGLSSLLKLIEIRVDPKHRPRTLKGVNIK